MRAMRTLGTMAVLGGAALVVYGCSAAANAPVDNSPDASGGASQDYGGGDNPSDASTTPRKDSGSTSGGGGGAYDAGPPKAPEGSPCDPSLGFSDPQASESCGMCGTQTRICQGGAADGGGPFTWAAWGACNGEVTGPDACDPSKTYAATACGNCGTMPQVCDSTTCQFETGFDCSEPANACHPGNTKFVLGASCTTSGQGRVYTCSAACSYGTPSACEVPPPDPNFITISSTVGTTVNKVFGLDADTTTGAVDAFSGCPATVDSSTLVSFIDIAINNPTARTVTVSLWDGPNNGTDDFDTVMTAYATSLYPPADMTACTKSNDDCTQGTDCTNNSSGSTDIFGWSGLTVPGSNAPTIPPNGTIMLHLALYDSATNANIKVYAKTEN